MTLQLTINGTSWLTFRDALQNETPFKTYGNLEGRSGSVYHLGRLPDEYADQYRARRDHITYTVMSYATPLAWKDDEYGWTMPNVRYSVTTSKAQGRIAPGIADLQGAAQ